MSSIYDWSSTAASNASADTGLTWQEGQAPSTVNDSARVMMKRVRDMLTDISGVNTVSGTANGITLTAASAFTAYANGRIVSFRAASSNTGDTTLNVNGIGSRSVRKITTSGEAPLSGKEIQAGGIYVAMYSASANAGAGAWVLQNPSADTAETLLSQLLSSPNNFTQENSFLRVRVTAVTDATETSTGHALQIGPDSGSNLRIDPNEILTVNNGVAGGELYIQNGINFNTGISLSIANGGTGAITASAARVNLGLGSAAVRNIGTSGSNVPLLDADNTWDGLNVSNSNWYVKSSAEAALQFLDGSGVLKGSIFSASTRDLWFRTRNTSGVPTGSMILSGGDLTLTGSLDVASGGTGAKTASDARANLGVPSTGITISAGLGLSGGGSIAANRTINADFGSLPLNDMTGFSAYRFVVLDGATSSTLSRADAPSVRNALGLRSLATMDASDILYAVGSVGSSAMMYGGGGSPGLPGGVVAGSSLNYSDTSRSTGGPTPTGSWRRMGYTEFGDRVTTYQRIS